MDRQTDRERERERERETDRQTDRQRKRERLLPLSFTKWTEASFIAENSVVDEEPVESVRGM